MKQANELAKTLKEPIPLFDLAFSIANVDGKFQVMVDIRSQALLNRFEELLGIDDCLEEPDLTALVEEKVDTPESQFTELDYSELTLQQKLEYLISKQIITEKKYTGYKAKLEDNSTGPGLLKYFGKQFDLLHNLHELAKQNKISDDTRATIYKRIMSSKMKDFSVIDNELKNLEAA